MATRVAKTVTSYLVGRVVRDGDWYVGRCLGLPVVTQGETVSEAMANLIDATSLFLETCVRKGTLEAVLLKYNWRPQLAPPQDIPKGAFALPVPIDLLVAKHAAECRA